MTLSRIRRAHGRHTPARCDRGARASSRGGCTSPPPPPTKSRSTRSRSTPPRRTARMCRFICRASVPCRLSTPSRSPRASTASCNGSPSPRGKTVNKGDLLAQIDPRPNQAASSRRWRPRRRTRRSSRTRSATSSATRSSQPQDLASKQTVDTQRALVDQLAAQLKVDQAVIDNARTQLDYTRITSPINGRTGIRLVDPGNIVHAARHHRHRRGDADAADLGDVHAAGGGARRSASRRSPRGPVKVATLSRARAAPCSTRARLASSTIRSTRPPAPSGSRPPSTTRTTRCGPASSSTRACWCAPSATR